ncbi:hypothetical protein [Mycetocola reblochoni]|uniref:Uncharacterized protein n=2 Tax=Mycetocola reblochoni TaxID=331618 RepID=A0A1R4KDG4_9MICO|nr:hypothetical protein [Mycetocola reblochoni]RLP68997.1 hypothetical protein D9V30_08995 [Mycetocola reblochoni]SJN42289.1 hypothetical protein FM119_13175 [Mycetocola reblochoni REB411]
MSRSRVMDVMTVLVALIAAGSVVAIGRGSGWALSLGTLVAVGLCGVRALLGRRRLRAELQPVAAAAAAEAELLTAQPPPRYQPDTVAPYTVSEPESDDPLAAEARAVVRPANGDAQT